MGAHTPHAPCTSAQLAAQTINTSQIFFLSNFSMMPLCLTAETACF